MTLNTHISSPCTTASEARCHCGQLMAILKKDGVELKCKRCKRLVFIPFTVLSPTDRSNRSCGNAPEDEVPFVLTHDHS